MKFLVAYATTQGHTRKIARCAADTLFSAGHFVELMPLADASTDTPVDFDRVILAASVHAGHYQKPLAEFLTAQAELLENVPSLFLSVSLAAAGHEADDWRSLDRIANDLSKATGWTPGRRVHLAGAYRPSEYDIVTRFIMRRIIAEKDPSADLDVDKSYTDWDALRAAVLEWAESHPA